MAQPAAFLRLQAFLKEECGSATVEFVLTVPLFVMLLMLTADATMLYNKQSSFQNVSRDTARIVARYGLTAAEAKAYATRRASVGGVTPTVDVTVLNGLVTVSISASSDEITPFGFIDFATGDTIHVAATNTMEPV